MPRFAYAAIDATGASVQGITKAGTIGEARSHLLDKQLYPVKIEEHRGKLQIDLTKQKVKKKSLMHFTRQLAVFVKAGIPLTDALETMNATKVPHSRYIACRITQGNHMYRVRAASGHGHFGNDACFKPAGSQFNDALQRSQFG